jgi:hypothetical protein
VFSETANELARIEVETGMSSYSRKKLCGEGGMEERSGRDVEPEGLGWDEALGKLFGALEKTC